MQRAVLHRLVVVAQAENSVGPTALNRPLGDRNDRGVEPQAEVDSPSHLLDVAVVPDPEAGAREEPADVACVHAMRGRSLSSQQGDEALPKQVQPSVSVRNVLDRNDVRCDDLTPRRTAGWRPPRLNGSRAVSGHRLTEQNVAAGDEVRQLR